jgi:hypothetical protein
MKEYPMRTVLLGTLAAIAAMVMTAASAEDDPDLLRYPAPELHPEKTGCETTTEGSRICVGDTAIAQDIACRSVADIYHTDKRREDKLEDVKRREQKFGCKDISGLRLRVIEIYQETGHACGVDYNHNKWCLTVEGLEDTTQRSRRQ